MRGSRQILMRLIPCSTRHCGTTVQVAGLLGGALAAGQVEAVVLPEDRADAMVHVYNGDGLRASGPALLIRKKMADEVSVTGSYYVDMVSNASIDVVTTASPYSEKRVEYGLGVDYLVRDSQVTLSTTRSTEPDYTASSASLDVAQEVFGGMTTISMGYTRASDIVGMHGYPDFSDSARHWKYRLGASQILSPRWLISANLEAISDDGFLGSPYRVARVFGAAILERAPRTRTSRALKFRAIGAVGESTSRGAVRAEYRYFWDTWDIQAHTTEFGYSRYFGDAWLADAYVRFNSQQQALFYSDNATADTAYVSRNRQLSAFSSSGIGVKLAYTVGTVASKYEVKVHGAYELLRFKYSNFTDIRTGSPYAFDAHVLQLFVSVSF